LSAPSADRAVPGRIEPTTAMGLSVCTVRLRKYAVSARVSVPWVMTMPSTSACLASCETRGQGQQVVVGKAFRGDLEHLFALDVGDIRQLGQAGQQLVHRHLGGRGGAVGR
jgi:hypothetical protein